MEKLENDTLQNLLDSIGDNPIKEKELDECFKKNEVRFSEPIKLALKRESLNINDFDAIDIAKFSKELREKIYSFKDGDGNWKITDKTKECDLPNFEEAEDIAYLAHDIYTMDDNKVDEIVKLDDELKKKCESVSGLKFKELSEWETNLVIEQILSYCKDATLTSLGNDIKN